MGAQRESTLESSDLFPALFEPFADQDQLTVLDLGAGSAETVNFFSQYRCQLTFADLCEDFAHQDTRPDEEGDLDQWFEDVLRIPAETRFDICLFWDVLNHLPKPAVAALGRCLRPHLHETSQGHGYGAFSATKPLLVSRYSVATARELVVRGVLDGADPMQAPYPHVQAEISQLLGCFEASRRTLKQGGRLEFLLRSTL